MYLKRFSTSLRNAGKGVDDGGEADGRVQPERPAVAHPGAQIGEGFDRQEQLEVGQAGGEAGHDGSHLRGKELADEDEGNRTQAHGVGDHEKGDAEQREPVKP